MTLMKHFINRFSNDKGAVAVSLALTMPFIVMLFSLTIDGARFQTSKARLADGLNQGVYSIAFEDNRNLTTEHKKINNALLSNYLRYYVPDSNIRHERIVLNAVENTDNGIVISVDYKASGDVTSNPYIATKTIGLQGFEHEVTIGNSSSSGVVRRNLEPVAADYVFVVDFSTSMTWRSVQAGLSRIQLLKRVVNDLGKEVLSRKDGSTIGFVPFSYGVPVKLDINNRYGGKEVGCSFIGKLKDEYDGLDWSFWYDKEGGGDLPYNKSQGLSNINTLKEATYRQDFVSGAYFHSIIADRLQITPWKPYVSDPGYTYYPNIYVDDPWRHHVHSWHKSNPATDLYSGKNQHEFLTNYNKFYLLTKSEDLHGSIVNRETMDIDATLSGDYLFKDTSVTTFIQHIGYLDRRPFRWTCKASMPFTTPRDYAGVAQTIQQPSYFLLELSDKTSVLDEFNAMTIPSSPLGYTDSMSGLLRSVPVIAKGKNKYKKIIVISDGEDSNGSIGPYGFNPELMQKHRVCDVIKDGLKKYPKESPANEADIYLVSIWNNPSVLSLWAKSCVGADNAFLATNIAELESTLLNIMNEKTLRFVDPRDSE